ncbi:MAG: hypothetical protein C7B47_09625 [Sulfobacillus thermosulfidooxidans]|uniref:Uncharacterized protein n=1 Tax=Sulfobacillus thermosulfidooxidans TaxID=28034 RepID=A0A2T2WX86_SULTH|nr:MAG: hypothetical protein C7B47_09625 [Sulfobacillus thermosulfidooxidans]
MWIVRPGDTPYDPSDELRQIDQQIVQLIQRRKTCQDFENIPNVETLHQWLGEDNDAVARSLWIFRMLGNPDLEKAPEILEPELPLDAESLMLEVEWDHYRLLLTHTIRYQEYSLVLSYLTSQQAIEQGILQVTLQIAGDSRNYHVKGQSMTSNNQFMFIEWLIRPALPQRAKNLTWSVVPSEKPIFNIRFPEMTVLRPSSPLNFVPYLAPGP